MPGRAARLWMNTPRARRSWGDTLETTMRIRGDAVLTPRFDSRPWRDPRLIVGVLLVVAASVLGGFAVTAADHTVGYWATRTSVRSGDPVSARDLVAVRAKVPTRTATSLLRTDRPLPDRLGRLAWAGDARSGTLITTAMLTWRVHSVELPVTVGLGGAPANLGRGDRVDVWAANADRSGSPGRAKRVLSGVRVLSRGNAAAVGGGSGYVVVVDAAGKRIDGLLVSAVSSGHVTVVRVS